jgi:hypothetical protein
VFSQAFVMLEPLLLEVLVEVLEVLVEVLELDVVPLALDVVELEPELEDEDEAPVPAGLELLPQATATTPGSTKAPSFRKLRRVRCMGTSPFDTQEKGGSACPARLYRRAGARMSTS